MNIKEAKENIKLPDEVLKLLADWNTVKKLYLKHKGDEHYEYMFKVFKKQIQYELDLMKIDIQLD